MLLSDKELIIDEGRIYNIITREDAVHSTSVFTSLMMLLIIMMTGEIRKLYLDGNAWIVAIGTILGIPFAKKLWMHFIHG